MLQESGPSLTVVPVRVVGRQKTFVTPPHVHGIPRNGSFPRQVLQRHQTPDSHRSTGEDDVRAAAGAHRGVDDAEQFRGDVVLDVHPCGENL
jgi:hypothetical protein